MEILLSFILATLIFIAYKLNTFLNIKKKTEDGMEDEDDDIAYAISQTEAMFLMDHPSGLSQELEHEIKENRIQYYKNFYKKYRKDSNTTLYPLFSEIDIGWEQLIKKEFQWKAEYYFNLLQGQEVREIQRHKEGGKDKITFEPSDESKKILKKKLNT